MSFRFQNLVCPVIISVLFSRLLACVGFGFGWLDVRALCIVFGAALHPWEIRNTTTICQKLSYMACFSFGIGCWASVVACWISRSISHCQCYSPSGLPPPCDTLLSSYPILSRFVWIPMCSPLMKGVQASRPIPIQHTTQVGPSYPI